MCTGRSARQAGRGARAWTEQRGSHWCAGSRASLYALQAEGCPHAQAGRVFRQGPQARPAVCAATAEPGDHIARSKAVEEDEECCPVRRESPPGAMGSSSKLGWRQAAFSLPHLRLGAPSVRLAPLDPWLAEAGETAARIAPLHAHACVTGSERGRDSRQTLRRWLCFTGTSKQLCHHYERKKTRGHNCFFTVFTV